MEKLNVNYLEGRSFEASVRNHKFRIEKISVEFSLPSAKSEKERQETMEWAEKCLIHNTIQHKPEIKIAFL